ncbi:MAG: hypothetical protein ACTSRR_09330 [Candidatus Heimdallarchaeaceae archaeon]
MAKYKLVPYIIRVREKGKKDQYLSLNDIDFFDLLVKTVKHYSNDNQGFHDPKNKRILLTTNISNKANRKLVAGTIKIGDYGVSTDFVNMKTREIIRNFRKEHFSELFPYHFFIYFPEGRIKDRAILLLQMKQNIGVKTFFEKAIKDFIYKEKNDILIEINALITQDKILKSLIQSETICEIRYIKTVVPNDVAERLGLDNYQNVSETRLFKAPVKKGGILFTKGKEKFVSTLLNERVKLLEIGDVKYDNIIFKYRKDNQQRTVSLDDLNIQERMTVDEKHLEFENGFPTIESMYKHAKDYLELIMTKIYQKPNFGD